MPNLEQFHAIANYTYEHRNSANPVLGIQGFTDLTSSFYAELNAGNIDLIEDVGISVVAVREDVTGKVTIGFRGTNTERTDDLLNDIFRDFYIATNKYGVFHRAAVLEVARVANEVFGTQLEAVTGHSIGGVDAALFGFALGLQTRTFDAPGIEIELQDTAVKASIKNALGISDLELAALSDKAKANSVHVVMQNSLVSGHSGFDTSIWTEGPVTHAFNEAANGFRTNDHVGHVAMITNSRPLTAMGDTHKHTNIDASAALWDAIEDSISKGDLVTIFDVKTGLSASPYSIDGRTFLVNDGGFFVDADGNEITSLNRRELYDRGWRKPATPLDYKTFVDSFEYEVFAQRSTSRGQMRFSPDYEVSIADFAVLGNVDDAFELDLKDPNGPFQLGYQRALFGLGALSNSVDPNVLDLSVNPNPLFIADPGASISLTPGAVETISGQVIYSSNGYVSQGARRGRFNPQVDVSSHLDVPSYSFSEFFGLDRTSDPEPEPTSNGNTTTGQNDHDASGNPSGEQQQSEGPDGHTSSGGKPILIDLDDDGLEIVPIDRLAASDAAALNFANDPLSTTFFDIDNDTYLERTSWLSGDDGFLVIDKNLNGQVDAGGELTFALDTPELDTDMEAVRALYDSNADGVLSSADTEFSKFRIWQDFDQDGVSDAGELRTLNEAGIVSVSLISDGIEEAVNGALIHGKSDVQLTNGTSLVAYDATIEGSDAGYRVSDDGLKLDLENVGIFVGARDGDVLNGDASALGADSLIGADLADHLFTTGDANVVFEGQGGNDILAGGSGNDWLSGGAGSDQISGGEGNDVLVIDANDIVSGLQGGAGFDIAIVEGSGGVNLDLFASGLEGAYGGSGDDVFEVSAASIPEADLFGALLSGYGGDDTLIGGAGDDILNGGLGADTLIAGAGNDQIVVDAKDISEGSIAGGDGIDTLMFEGFESLVIDLDAIGVEQAFGGIGDDIITNSGSVSVNVHGAIGNDQITGGTGDDAILGGIGQDTLDGGAGFDYVSYVGSSEAVLVDLATGLATGGDATGDIISNFESVIGSSHGDILVGDSGVNALLGEGGNDLLFGGAGDSDYLDGGSGLDSVFYEDSTSGVTIDLGAYEGGASGGDAEGDRLFNIENVIGSDHDDSLVGDDGSNLIEGGGGADSLSGGEGIDTLSYAGSDAGVSANLSDGSTSGGDAAGDTITGFENLSGSDFDDTLVGDDTDNILRGGAGVDALSGGAGADTLIGGHGADTLDGGADMDIASYQGAESGVAVSLLDGTGTAGEADGDILTNIEGLVGSDHADVLTGDDADNILEGGSEAFGVEGDLLVGGAGQDTLSYSGSLRGVGVDLSRGMGTQVFMAQSGFDASNVSGLLTLSDHVDAFGNTTAAAVVAHDGPAGTVSLAYGEVQSSADWNVSTIEAGDPSINAVADYDAWVILTASHTITAAGLPNGTAHLRIYTGDDVSQQGLEVVDSTGAVVERFDFTREGNIAARWTFAYNAETGQTLILKDDVQVGSVSWEAGLSVMIGHLGVSGLTATLTETTDISGLLGLDGDDSINDVFTGFENLTGSAFGDELRGDDGDNTLTGGVGDDRLIGGAGVDIASYGGSVEGYSVVEVFEEDGVTSAGWEVTDLSPGLEGDDGTDRLEGIEQVSFTDRTVYLDGSQNNAPIAKASKIYVREGSSVSWQLTGADFDVADSLEFGGGGSFASAGTSVTVTSSEGVTVTIEADGSYTYDASTLGAGVESDSFTFSVRDSNGAVHSSQVDVTVSEDIPVPSNTDFAVLSSSDRHSSVSVSSDGLSGDASSWYQAVRSDKGVSTGKWYYEYRQNVYGTYAFGGFATDEVPLTAKGSGPAGNWSQGYQGGYWAVTSGGTIFMSPTGGYGGLDHLSGTNAITDVGFALDLDNNRMYVRYNGVWQNGADPEAGTGGYEIASSDVGKTFYAIISGGDASYNQPFSVNFGSGSAGPLYDTSAFVFDADAGGHFLHAPPSGFAAINDGNITRAESALDVDGTSGADIILGSSGNDALQGHAGDEDLTGGLGSDLLDGGEGVDTARYDGSGSAVSIDLSSGSASGGDAAGDVLISIENLVGSDHDDTLRGSSGDNVLTGGSGDDLLEGRSGADTLEGGSGVDTADYSGSTSGVTVDLGDGAVEVGGHAEGDTLGGIENITGSDFDDQLTGDSGANTLVGGAGDDTFGHTGGSDHFEGGSGSDTIDFGAASDDVTISLTPPPGTVSLDAVSLDTASAQYLSKTFGSGGSRQQATLSLWLKQDTLGTDRVFFGSNTSGQLGLRFDNYNKLQIWDWVGGSFNLNLKSTDTFTDTTSFQHVVFSIDTTASVASDRVKVFVDGAEITLTGTYPPQNATLTIGQDGTDYGVGYSFYSTQYYDGEIADVHYVDGVALGADAFGEDRDGSWQATAYEDAAGYGANGFHLDFADSSNLGLDASGGTAFTLNNITSVDQVTGTGLGYDVVTSASAQVGADQVTFESIENVTGGAGNDAITGDGSANRLEGGDGDDTLTGGAGNDTLIGGLGVDVASYGGSVEGYSVVEVFEEDGVTSAGWEVTDLSPGLEGDDGTDRLEGIEQVSFTDRTVYLDGSQNNAPIAKASKIYVREGSSVSWQLTGADFDVADSLEFGGGGSFASAGTSVTVTSSEGVTVTIEADGSYTYDASTLGAGVESDSFTFSVRDSNGAVHSSQVDVTVSEDIPVPSNTDFAVLSSSDRHSSVSVSSDGLSGDASSWYQAVRSDKGVSTGKWYYEYRQNVYGTYAFGGFATDEVPLTAKGSGPAGNWSQGYQGGYWAVTSGGTIFMSPTGGYGGLDHLSGTNAITDVGFALDLDNNRMYVRYNGVWQNGADPEAGTGGYEIASSDVGKTFYAIISGGDASYNQPFSVNFGSGSAGPLYDTSAFVFDEDAGGQFLHAPPSGFAAINDGNITRAESAVDVDGTSGADIILGSSGNDVLQGHAGDEDLTGGLGGDLLDGGEGVDTARYDGSGSAVSIDLSSGNASGGDAAGDVLISIENLVGSDHDDTLRGSSGDNVLTGGSGDDLLEGRSGADTLEGGSGVDTADYSGSTSGVTVDLGDGAVEVGGHAEGDTLGGIENITGSDFDDQLTGDSGANTLVGGAGDDTFGHTGGSDHFEGGSGSDTIDFGAASDDVTISLTPPPGTVSLDAVSLDTASAQYLSKTFGSGGSRQQATLSLWLKQDTLGTDRVFFGSNTSGQLGLRFDNYNKLQIWDWVGGSFNLNLKSTDTFTDTTSFQHVVFSIDTTASVASDRVKVFVDGAEITLTGTYPPQNATLTIGQDGTDYGVGYSFYSTQYYDGEIADVHYVDGVALGADAFGEDRDGSWQATAYEDAAGYGANGFHLDFADSSNLGLDASGGTAFTLNNITSVDQVTGTGLGYDVVTSASAQVGADQVTFESIENVTGGAGNDAITGDGSANRLEGGDGDDTLTGGAGNDTLIGGLGVDVASYGGSVEGYSVVEVFEEDGVTSAGWEVTDLSPGLEGDDGTDRLEGIEQVSFTDRTVYLDGSQNNAPIAKASKIYVREGSSVSWQLTGADFDVADSLEFGGGGSFASAGTSVTVTSSEGVTVTIEADGSYTYDASTLGAGVESDSFTFSVRDSNGAVHSSQVDVTVSEDIPVPSNTDFAVLSSSDRHSSVSVSSDGLSGDASSWYQAVRSDKGVSTGKWYYEYRQNVYGTYAFGGFATDEVPLTAKGSGPAGNWSQGYQGGYWAVTSGGTIFMSPTGGYGGLDHLSGTNAITDVGFALDLDNNRMYVRYNGVWQNGADPEAGTGGYEIASSDVGKTFYAIISGGDASYNQPFSVNFGSGSAGPLYDTSAFVFDEDAGGQFLHAPPSGFAAINDGNITRAESAVDVDGTSGADIILGSSGNDVLQGHAGDEDLTGGLGGDLLDGGEGVDTARYDGSGSAVSIDLSSGNASGGDAAGDVLISIENLVGSDHDDTLRGSSGDNVLTGGSGDDLLEGRSGADTLIGGTGVDLLNGGSGNDVLEAADGVAASTIPTGVIEGAINLALGSTASSYSIKDGTHAEIIDGDTDSNFPGAASLGNDTLGASATGVGYWQLDFGAATQFDTIRFFQGSSDYRWVSSVKVQTSSDGTVWADVSTEAVVSGENTLTFASQDSRYVRLLANSPIQDPNGNIWNDTWRMNELEVYDTRDLGNTAVLGSTLLGGDGNDVLIGGTGDDTLDGGAGHDTVAYEGSSEDYAIWANTDGSFTVKDERGGSPDGSDTITGIETLQFSNETLNFTVGNVAPIARDTKIGLPDTTSARTITGTLSGSDIEGDAVFTLEGANGAGVVTLSDGVSTFSLIDSAAGHFELNLAQGSTLTEAQLAYRVTEVAAQPNETVALTAFANVDISIGAPSLLEGDAGTATLSGGSGNDVLEAADGVAASTIPTGVIEGAINLALGSTASSYSIKDGTHAEIIDGDTDSNFPGAASLGNDTLGASATGVGYWQLDFGAATQFDTIRFFQGSSDYRWVSSVKVQTSSDGTVWADVSTEAVVSGENTLTFASQDSRYVRLLANSPIQDPNGNIWNDTWRMNELEVYDTRDLGNTAVLGSTLLGGDGNDVLIGGTGDDTLDGGAGHDTVAYEGSSEDYAIWANTDGSFTVKDERGGSPDGSDTITGIETLQFSNETLNFTVGNVAPIARDTKIGLPDTTSARTITGTLSGSDIEGDAVFTLEGANGAGVVTLSDGVSTFSLIDSAAGHFELNLAQGSTLTEAQLAYRVTEVAAQPNETVALTAFANVDISIGAPSLLEGDAGTATLSGGSGNDVLEAADGVAASTIPTGVIEGAINLALGSTASSYSIKDGTHAEIIDGDTDSNFPGAASLGNDTLGALATGVGYWQLDFGAATQFDTIRFFQGSTDYRWVSSVKVQTSTDGTVWADVSTETVVSGENTLTFDGQDSRYVRLLADSPVQDPNGNIWNDTWQMNELEVYDTRDLGNTAVLGSTLLGGDGDDVLIGGTGDDTLNGGIGDDDLTGGTGDDTYQYSVGDGSDSLSDTGGANDVLEFGSGVSVDNLWLDYSDANSFGLGVDGSLTETLYSNISDKIELAGGAVGHGGVETIRFDDGSTIDLAQLIQAVSVFDTNGEGAVRLSRTDVRDTALNLLTPSV